MDLANKLGDPARVDASLSDLARGVVGSEILRIAAEIRALKAKGAEICNLTVGDFDPAQFAVPAALLEGVRGALAAGARANREAACRKGSIEVISAPGTLIATGDLHDNPLHFAKLVRAAGMDEPGPDSAPPPPVPTHLVLHEIIHSDRLINGMDFSYRALARVAALKARFPELVHALLANHELSQVFGAGIVKDGVRVVEAFNDAVDYAFGEDAASVTDAIKQFIMSMPLALRCVCPGGDILVSHSLPATALMSGSTRPCSLATSPMPTTSPARARRT